MSIDLKNENVDPGKILLKFSSLKFNLKMFILSSVLSHMRFVLSMFTEL